MAAKALCLITFLHFITQSLSEYDYYAAKFTAALTSVDSRPYILAAVHTSLRLIGTLLCTCTAAHRMHSCAAPVACRCLNAKTASDSKIERRDGRCTAPWASESKSARYPPRPRPQSMRAMLSTIADQLLPLIYADRHVSMFALTTKIHANESALITRTHLNWLLGQLHKTLTYTRWSINRWQ